MHTMCAQTDLKGFMLLKPKVPMRLSKTQEHLSTASAGSACAVLSETGSASFWGAESRESVEDAGMKSGSDQT